MRPYFGVIFMVSLRQVQREDKALLFNLLQKMLCEMTNYYDNDIDSEGNFEYRYFEGYFSGAEPDRLAFLIEADKKIAGFLMVNAHSYIGQSPDHVLAEFFVLPKFRRKHVARDAVSMLFRRLPGAWEIKYHTRNIPAARLWNQTALPYAPQIHYFAEHEEVLSFRVTSPL